MANTNKIKGLQNGALTHSGIENMICDGDGIIEMGAVVELVSPIQEGELLPRVQESFGIRGSPLVYGIAVGGDADGFYAEDGGSDAAAFATISGAQVQSITVVAPGNEYLTVPDVIIDSSQTVGSGATATATLTDGRVTSIAVNMAGSGYDTVVPPVVRITRSPRTTTRATTEIGQTVRVLTRGKCPARVVNRIGTMPISSGLAASEIPGVLSESSQLGADTLGISLDSVATDDLDIIIIEVVKQGDLRV